MCFHESIGRFPADTRVDCVSGEESVADRVGTVFELIVLSGALGRVSMRDTTTREIQSNSLYRACSYATFAAMMAYAEG